MKRLLTVVAMAFAVTVASFAQSNSMTPLAVIKVNKSKTETITLGQLKTRADTFAKTNGNLKLTPEQRKDILEALIDEKLVLQKAMMDGVNLTDSQVDQYFLSSISQQVGREISEAEYSELVKQQTGKTLDQYMTEVYGMNLSAYKSYLKSQIICQQYVLAKRQKELQKIAATEDQVSTFYAANEAQFVQPDTVKLYLAIIPKGKNAAAAKTKANALYSKFKSNPSKGMDIIKADADFGKSFQAGDILVGKTNEAAAQLGIPFKALQELFGKSNGFVSEVTETESDFQFYSILDKYSKKALSLNDPVQPGESLTVKEYIRQHLTVQLQNQFLNTAVEDLVKELDVPANVERKKTGADLLKLLNW